MPVVYASKEELTDAIKKSYLLYDQEFDAINESEKDLLKANIDKTPSENLSYQIGWTGLLLSWESDELNGIHVKTPTPEFKWNNLKGLHQSFYNSYGSYSLKEQREILSKQITEKQLQLSIVRALQLLGYTVFETGKTRTKNPFKNDRQTIWCKRNADQTHCQR